MKTLDPLLLFLATEIFTGLRSLASLRQSLPAKAYPPAVLQVVHTSALLHVEHFTGQAKQLTPDWYWPSEQLASLMQAIPLMAYPDEHAVQVVAAPWH